MASSSKEYQVLKLILENSPLKEWHFEEIIKEAHITRAAANKWLSKYVKEGLLKRVKEKGSFPYFTAGKNNYAYAARKRAFAMEEIHASGLLRELLSIEGVKAIIIFGSMIKGDWYKHSDIDVFIYGNMPSFDKSPYEKKLQRHIEIHLFPDAKDIKETQSGLIRNVMNGYLVKGDMQEIAEAQ